MMAKKVAVGIVRPRPSPPVVENSLLFAHCSGYCLLTPILPARRQVGPGLVGGAVLEQMEATKVFEQRDHLLCPLRQ